MKASEPLSGPVTAWIAADNDVVDVAVAGQTAADSELRPTSYVEIFTARGARLRPATEYENFAHRTCQEA